MVLLGIKRYFRRQVLITNAIQHNRCPYADCALIRIYCLTKGDTAMTYVIRSANGLTISEENKEKIFQTEEEAEIHLSFLQF